MAGITGPIRKTGDAETGAHGARSLTGVSRSWRGTGSDRLPVPANDGQGHRIAGSDEDGKA